MRNTNTPFTVGQKLTNEHAFTTPTGVHFPKGSVFVVNLIGVSTRCHHETTQTIVWISDGCFLSNG